MISIFLKLYIFFYCVVVVKDEVINIDGTEGVGEMAEVDTGMDFLDDVIFMGTSQEPVR